MKITSPAGKNSELNIEYPFRFGKTVCNTSESKPFATSADVSSDARFFVATAVLSILYCVFIAGVYSTIDEIYISKPEIPLAVSLLCFVRCLAYMFRLIFNCFFLIFQYQDFVLTAILALFWFCAAVAWSNGADGLKTATDATVLKSICPGWNIWTSSFSRLNISLLIGYLNFFLWGSDLWFLYKETHWFKERQQQNAESIGGSNMNAPNI